MPRIPLSQSSGLIQHTRSQTPINGHGMRIVAPVNNDAANFANLSKGLNTAAAGLADYFERSQAVENRLAAAQDRALLRDEAKALELQLADEPNAPDDEKAEWIRRFQMNWEEKRKDILDRMDPDFRKLHDAEIVEMQKDISHRQSFILIQGRAQRLKNEADQNYKLYCQQGNWQEAERLVDEMAGDVWTVEQAKRLKDVDLPMRKDHFTAKAMADNVPQRALDELNAKDAKGNFVNYKHLTPDDRRALVKYAQSVSNQKEMEEDQAVAAAYEAGKKLYTDEQLTELHDAGTITDKQFVRYKNWNKAFDREQSTLATRQANLRKAQRQQAVNAFYATALYNPDGSPKVLTQADASRICLEGKEKFFGPDADGLTAFYDRVYSQVEKAAAGKTFAQSAEGKAILKYINDKAVTDFIWDENWGIFSWVPFTDQRKDPAYLISQKVQLLSIAEPEFKRNGGDVEKTIKALDARLKDLNDGKITNILQGYPVPDIQVGKYTLPAKANKPAQPANGATGMKNGRKTIYLDGVWYYAK